MTDFAETGLLRLSRYRLDVNTYAMSMRQLAGR